MKVLKKVYENNTPVYHVESDDKNIVKVVASDNMSDEEIEKLIEYVCDDVDIQNK